MEKYMPSPNGRGYLNCLGVAVLSRREMPFDWRGRLFDVEA